MNFTKRSIEGLMARSKRYFVWDESLKGFGIRVEPSGRKSFLCRYRIGTTRRQYQLGPFGTITVEEVKSEASRILSSSVLGNDPAQKRYEARRSLRFAELVALFEAEHLAKLKPTSRMNYMSALTKHAIPALGRTPADAVTPAELNRLHLSLSIQKTTANRLNSYIRSLYSWADHHGFVPRDFNPARYVKPYKEQGRERYLTSDELKRLGDALRLAEMTGLPWVTTVSGEKSKHLAKDENRKVV